MKQKKLLFLTLIIGLVYFTIGGFSLSHYGPNWDEPVHFLRGHATLHYLLTGEKNYNKIEKTPSMRKSEYKLNYYNFNYFESHMAKALKEKKIFFSGGGHPMVSDILAALSNSIFYEKLGVVGDIEAYHLYSVFTGALLIAFLFLFVAKEYTIFAAFITVLSFGLYPLFLAESRFNIKDIPQTSFYALTVLFFYNGFVKNSWKWIALSALFSGLALGTKLNIIFIPFIILPWFFIYSFQLIRKETFLLYIKKRKAVFVSFLLYPIFGFILFVGSWPHLWPDLWNRFLTVVFYYRKIGLGDIDEHYTTLFGFNTYPFQWVIFATPVVTLIISIFGILYVLSKGWNEERKTSFLIALFFLVPILRVSLPNMTIYGGGRQIMEYIPAMAILTGIGADKVVKLLNGYIAILIKTIWKKQFNNIAIEQWSNRIRVVLQLIVIVSFIPITLRIISLYPFESTYFNELIGGLKGAKERNFSGWGNSLGSTYLRGIEWLNKNAEKNSRLTTIYELRSNIPAFLLRKDLQYANTFRSTIRREGEYIMGVVHYGTNGETYNRKYLDRYLDPVYALIVDGVPVLKIWKNDLEHTKPSYRKKEGKVENFSVEMKNRLIRIDLKQRFAVTGVRIRYQSDNCTVPTLGYFEYSTDNRHWIREPGDFTKMPFSTWFKTQPEKGILQYLFAAEPARFIQVITSDERSCLLNNEVEIGVFTFV